MSNGASLAQLMSGGLVRLWVGTATTVNGVAAFNVTDDGTPSGNPVFLSIVGAFPAAEASVSNPTDAPIAVVRKVSADRASITVSCFTGAVLSILGATLAYAPDGTIVHLLVIGA